MKKLIVLVLAARFALSVASHEASAQGWGPSGFGNSFGGFNSDTGGLSKGYHGMVEWGNGVDLSFEEWGTCLVTTHGYQFNPYLFLGVNLGFYLYDGDEVWPMLLGLDFRVYVSPRNKLCPYFGLRGGFLYSDFMAGVRYALNKSLGLNFSISAGMSGALLNVGFEF